MTSLFTTALLILIAQIASLNARELKRITMGYPSLAFTQSHVWVAKEQGLFRKYGLEVDPVFLRGGQLATQALAAGEPPIVNVGTVIQANLTGYNLMLIISMENKFYQLVFVRPRHRQPGAVKRQKTWDQRLRLDHALCRANFTQTSQSRAQQRRCIDRRRTGRGATGRHERRQDRRVIF